VLWVGDQLNAVGPAFAAVFTAELGDVTRFKSAKQVVSWAGLTPRHRESATTVHKGSIAKQGIRAGRWAAVEAISKNHGDDATNLITGASLNDEAATRIGRRRPANSSRWSTTGYATARSGTSFRPRPRDCGTRSGDCELE
jgi:hypothetical protein